MTKSIVCFVLLSLMTLYSCDGTETSQKPNLEENTSKTTDSTVTLQEDHFEEVTKMDTLEIVVNPCANGYEYAMHGYDFNPVLESSLNQYATIDVKPFPYKALMGSGYHGVFDIKYCETLLEKVSADFIILTRFDRAYNVFNQKDLKWGYELKIIDTKKREQRNSLSAHNLNSYEELEEHIRNNIDSLKTDLLK